MKRTLSFSAFFLMAGRAFSQGSGMLSDDGSGVVVGGLVLIFVGFFVFLWATERKLAKAEKRNKA